MYEFQREPEEWSVLWSGNGCKTQRPHRDYFCDDITDSVQAESEHSYAAIISLTDSSYVPIWRDSDISQLFSFQVVTLNAGDILVFRDDTIHAGGPYPSGHFGRLHCYLQSSKVRHRFGQNDWIKSITASQLRELDVEVTRQIYG